ncbi:lectin, galactoside-binding, soluble, 2b [Denticeps clupeoides]|uniref:Galectin n=1 Tax=Denticeps clupeoides TaxID=299321 RepID=A0AAY4ECD9_9TELE|nr:beta-galactoside-binding lectin-like [Denticeps clupeoides]XP_028829892.1 beta-galactoside-binding lectin-like [Denticeps clupeoides]
MFTVKNMSFKAGRELKISGKVKSSPVSFSVNIGHNEEAVALHFSPRFDENGDINTIVCNSLQSCSWGSEHKEGCFPFQPDSEFKITITFNNDEFYIKLPDGHMMSFPNRYGDDSFKHIHVNGDVKIYSIKIK